MSLEGLESFLGLVTVDTTHQNSTFVSFMPVFEILFSCACAGA